MKQFSYITLLVMLMCITSIRTFAYDIAVENSDGVTIYYNYINNGKELEVVGSGGVSSLIIPEEVTYMNRTRKVTRIGANAFRNKSLTSVVIPQNVVKIGEYAFSNTLLYSVKIPNGVIDEFAFYYTSLNNVIIGDGVTTIGRYAFARNKGLVTIKFGKAIKKIWSYAFYDCNGLKKVITTDLKRWCGVIFGYDEKDFYGQRISITDLAEGANPLDYAHHLYSNDSTEIVDLVIPNGVSTINSLAFRWCDGLKTVKFPNSVTTIKDYAFSSCDSLNSISFGNKIKSIYDNAFNGCTAIKRVEIADIAAWSEMACTHTPCIYSHSLYYDGEEITNLVIPEGVVNVGNFAYLDNLTQVTIPMSAVTIKDEAFEGCNKLSSVVLPNGIKEVGNKAFYNCPSLISVDISENVQTIGSSAFNCSNLATVTSRIKKPFAINGSVFSQNTLYNATLYVPKGTINAYKKTDGWKDFVWIEGKDLNSTIEQIMNDSIREVSRYNINGNKIDASQRGLIILKLSNGTTKKVLKE